jgi:hypothetical protein
MPTTEVQSQNKFLNTVPGTESSLLKSKPFNPSPAQAVSQLTSLKPMVEPSFSSKPSFSGSSIPDLKIPGVDLSFLNRTPTFNAPSYTSALDIGKTGGNTSGPMVGPTVSSPSFMDRLKSFGQQALGGIKNLFGF